ncbi:Plasma membrane sulfite pump involved in sulfite metabolism [Arachnomyces sp. PD_36]|nr:Plasma membrane sulfite pump involved in sulfite metabolism [Arachnomyces sp. PD_36]
MADIEKRASGEATDDFPDSSSSQECEPKVNPEFRHEWPVVANFLPAWFAVNMGTGITAILLEKLPHQFNGLHYIATCIFALNVFLFCLFLFLSVVRYTVWPEKFMQMINHPVQSLFTGTFPMGLATIVNLVVYICVPAWGEPARKLAWALWWIDVVFSVATCFIIPWILISRHETKLEIMTAAWLLPIVANVVVAASGGVVAEVLTNKQHALWTIIASYILWGTGVPLAVVVIVVYFQRLAFHKVPPKQVIVSVFLPLGPLGQGSFGIMQLGKVAKQLFPHIHFISPTAGEVFYASSFMVGLIMWGFALIWIFFALMALCQGKFPFNLGWWAFTFPLGVFTTATYMFATEFESEFFAVIGTILGTTVTLLWLMVSTLTIWKAFTGELFRI